MDIKTTKLTQFDLMLRASGEIDFNNYSDVVGYATLIFSAANEVDILTTSKHLQSQKAIIVMQLAKAWVNNVQSRIKTMAAGEALDITEPFDFMHRIAHRAPTPQDFIDKYILKAFDALIHGDKTVNEYHLFRFLRQQINRKNKAFFDRPLQWYSSSLDRWLKKFQKGICIEQFPDYDTLEIVYILMSEDLFAFVQDQKQFKEKLFKNHTHYLDKTNELDEKQLAVLSQILLWSGKFMPHEEKEEYDLNILRAMIEHPNTNRFYRCSLQKNLELRYE